MQAFATMVLAAHCQLIWQEAIKTLGNDLRGSSVLDLCADNTPLAELADLKRAIILSGIFLEASDRIRDAILGYLDER